MGERNEYTFPLIIIVLLLVIFVLFGFIVISTREVWVPFVASKMPPNRPSQTAYPTYTSLPTYTMFSTARVTNTPEYKTGYLSNYDMNITIPFNWNIWETNPRKFNGDGATCYDYLIDSPDYKQEIKIYVMCGSWDTNDSFCPNGVVSIGRIQDTNIVRFPDQSISKKYIYSISYSGSDCEVPGVPSIWLKFHGELKTYFISYSFSGSAAYLDLADSMVLSFLHNP